MSTYKQMSFDEWLNFNPDMEKRHLKELGESTEKCTECKGYGEVECSECGSEIVCENCNGTGVEPVVTSVERMYNRLYAFEKALLESIQLKGKE